MNNETKQRLQLTCMEAISAHQKNIAALKEKRPEAVLPNLTDDQIAEEQSLIKDWMGLLRDV